MTMNFHGIPVIVSPHVTFETRPLRIHRKNKGSAAYHRRIQKKWTKRFGETVEYHSYLISAPTFGIGRQILVMHPTQVALLKESKCFSSSPQPSLSECSSSGSIRSLSPSRFSVWEWPESML